MPIVTNSGYKFVTGRAKYKAEKDQEIKLCDAWCIGCKYSHYFDRTLICDYIGVHNHSRGCAGGHGCQRFEFYAGGITKGSNFNPSVYTRSGGRSKFIKERSKTNRLKLCFNGYTSSFVVKTYAAKHKAFEEGKNNLEIAAVGYEPITAKKKDYESYEE